MDAQCSLTYVLLIVVCIARSPLEQSFVDRSCSLGSVWLDLACLNFRTFVQWTPTASSAHNLGQGAGPTHSAGLWLASSACGATIAVS
jgi:hypothetical protein